MSADDVRRPPARLSRVLVALPLLVAAAMAVLFAWGMRNHDDALPSALLGQPAPEFALPPVGGRGEGFSSADLRGEVSIVNVWASWCAPCREEMPLLVELAEAGIVPIHGINYKDDPEAALAFLDEVGDPYTRNGADTNGRVGLDWGVYGLPETFVVDAEGRIAHKHVGPFDRKILEETILPVVERLRAEGGGARRGARIPSRPDQSPGARTAGHPVVGGVTAPRPSSSGRETVLPPSSSPRHGRGIPRHERSIRYHHDRAPDPAAHA